MEGNKKENEEKKGLTVGKTGACPCHTTPKEAKWDEARWKKHWADRRKGHEDMLAKLHKESRG